MRISVAHIKDGLCEYNETQFEYGEKELKNTLKKFHEIGVDVKINDVISCAEEGELGDHYYYVVNHRQLGFAEDDGTPFIIYWIDDFDDNNLFKTE